MNILLVGSGGREHALAWKLAQSPQVEKLLVAPGNPGLAQVGHNVPVETDATHLLIDVARHERVGLASVVAGPLLSAGLADAFAAAGVPAFGASAAAARLGASRIFARQLLDQAGVPAPTLHIFDDPASAAEFVRASRRAWIVGADGPAGARATVAGDVAETLAAIEQAAAGGARIWLEQPLDGHELTIMALCDGTNLLPLSVARPYRRLRDGDTGPLTDGMGAYAPVAEMDEETIKDIVDRRLRPIVRALAAAGAPLRGALCARLALTAHGPQVLDVQATFGDPETQAILPLIEGDLLPALLACATGGDGEPGGYAGAGQPGGALDVRAGAAACVVLAAAGYPDAPHLGDPIVGLEAVDEPAALLFHGTTEWQGGVITACGGRPLCVVGLGATPRAARDRAYEVVEDISFAGMQYRRDIG
jgi:phosphoribosylamine---glycine ligase